MHSFGLLSQLTSQMASTVSCGEDNGTGEAPHTIHTADRERCDRHNECGDDDIQHTIAFGSGCFPVAWRHQHNRLGVDRTGRDKGSSNLGSVRVMHNWRCHASKDVLHPTRGASPSVG